MNRRHLLPGILGFILLVGGGVFAYQYWNSRTHTDAREEMLSLLPADPSAVVFLDLGQFRKSAFLPLLMSWIPRAAVEEEYAQFVKETGFDYERDLDRAALALTGRGANATSFAIAEGRFDRKKFEQYAREFGQSIDVKGMRVFTLRQKSSARPSYFTFLRDDRIAWTNDSEYSALFLHTRTFNGKIEWQEHFSRVSGSAAFGVMREDGGTAATWEQQAPGGLRSPQLATLLSQLQWITVAGKPEEKNLRVVIEGESATESVANQLNEFLQGMLIMAQAGLNGAQNRKQMEPQLREAYLELLKSAEVEKVNRGEGKSVRVVFEVTPGFLDAVKKAGVAGANGGH